MFKHDLASVKSFASCALNFPKISGHKTNRLYEPSLEETNTEINIFFHTFSTNLAMSIPLATSHGFQESSPNMCKLSTELLCWRKYCWQIVIYLSWKILLYTMPCKRNFPLLTGDSLLLTLLNIAIKHFAAKKFTCFKSQELLVAKLAESMTQGMLSTTGSFHIKPLFRICSFARTIMFI